jgi:ankyrin repeat protein
LKPTHAALSAAVKNRNQATIKRLLEEGVPINGDKDEYSALHMALTGWDLDVVRLLFDEGADPNRLDPYGRIPAMTVIRVRRAPSRQSLEAMRAEFDRRIVQPLQLLASYGVPI